MTRCSEVTDKKGNDVELRDVSGASISFASVSGKTSPGLSIVGGRDFCEGFGPLSDRVLFGLDKPFSDSIGLDDQAETQLTITLLERDSVSLTDRGFESIFFGLSDSVAVNAASTLIVAGYGEGGYGRIGYGGRQTRQG